MMNRSATSSVTGRSAAMRRMRRRTHAATAANRLFCGTNGCASFLEVDAESGTARCHICGFVRRVH
jgi:transcription elongation factor Elf1